MLDRYELREVLGTGAFATVWRAHDPMLGTDVAIKVLADNWARDPGMRERFLTEARLALEATSPHLVRVHHVAVSADRNIPYIVMALATGGTLEARLRAERVHLPSPRQALELTRDIAVAVASLHDLGLLHRDLKPANVLFHTNQGRERPMLGDFGLARSIERTALTLVGGTPTYAAPEQAAGLTQLTKPADIFPLGIMFLEMITGDVPHHATMVDAATATVDVSAFLAKNGVALDPGTHGLITAILDPSPENRPADAHELIRRIDALLTGPASTLPIDHPGAASGQPLAPDPNQVVAEAPSQPNNSAVTSVPQSPTVAVSEGAQGSDRALHDRVSSPPAAPGGLPAGPRDASLEPNSPASSIQPSSKRGPLLAGLAALILLPAIGIGSFLLLSGEDNPEPTATESTTTTTTTTTPANVAAENPGPEPTEPEPAPEPTITTTTATIPPSDEPGLPAGFPVPAGAVIDRRLSTGDQILVYNLAGSPEGLAEIYNSFNGWEVVTNQPVEANAVSLMVSNGTENVSVVGAPVENTAGVSITRLTITPADEG